MDTLGASSVILFAPLHQVTFHHFDLFGDAGEAGEHLGVAPVALALVAGNGLKFARVGHQYRCAVFGKLTVDPRNVRARFQGDGGAGINYRESS